MLAIDFDFLLTCAQSAMDHSLVEGLSANEQLRVDCESTRVATRAVEALNQSRIIMRQAGDDVAVPTWTGRSGEAGAPPAVRKRFGGASTAANGRVTGGGGAFAPIGGGIGSHGGGARSLTSTELLTQMRERRVTAQGGEGGEGGGGALALRLNGSLPRTGGGAGVGVEMGGLEGSLTSFLRAKGRGVGTAVVLEQFREFVEQKGMGEFKKALREVAALLKQEGGGANWVLKTRV